MPQSNSFKTKSLIALAALTMACGTTLAPKELLDAREAYNKAASGPAAKVAPAQLDNAKQALDKAEASFKNDGDGDTTKNLAYIAQRRAEIAASAGEIEQANQDRAQATKDLSAAQLALTESATKNLNKTKAELEKEKRQAELERLEGKHKEAQSKDEIARTKKQLDEEKNARLALEKKYQAAMASIAEIAKVKEEARGVVITISGEVLFATNKYELLPIAQNKLDDVAKALKDQGYKQIVVEGHTDSRGSAKKNEELSFQRADSVRTYLVSRGIESGKIKAVGIGPSRPVASNDTAEGRANNRRVEMIVTPQ
jgi:outer membrane protein OmpA-like peptidoglycan-associated protein